MWVTCVNHRGTSRCISAVRQPASLCTVCSTRNHRAVHLVLSICAIYKCLLNARWLDARRAIYIYTTRPYGARCSLARRTMRCGVYQYVRQECGRAKRSSCAALTSASPVVVLSFCLLPVGVYNAQSGAVIDWLFAFSGPFPVQPSPHTGRTKSTLGRWYCLRTLGS